MITEIAQILVLPLTPRNPARGRLNPISWL
jgi:hypothetical protein